MKLDDQSLAGPVSEALSGRHAVASIPGRDPIFALFLG